MEYWPQKVVVIVRITNSTVGSACRPVYFFAMENKIKPIPNMISVMGQGSGSPRGFGLFRIINVESAIRRNPDMVKHIFDIFNIITSLSWILVSTIIFALIHLCNRRRSLIIFFVGGSIRSPVL